MLNLQTTKYILRQINEYKSIRVYFGKQNHPGN